MNHSHSPSSSDDAATTAATPEAALLATTEGAPVYEASVYEAPAIESIFSPDDLHREVLYAAPGTPSIPDPNPPPF